MDSCPVCGGTSLLKHHILSECLTCSHVFQTDMSPTIDYTGGYGETRYDLHSESMSFLRTGYIIGRAKSIGKVLDVGYGNGLFLKTIRRAGSEIFGIDVHNKDYGIPKLRSLRDMSRFDVVTFFDSLEHIADLAIVEEVESSDIFISIPHRPHWFLSYPEQWRHFRPGEHLHYFSTKSLCTLMGMAGYTLSDECCMEDSLRGKCVRFLEISDNIHTYHFKQGIHDYRI
jgi:hypothetical protein